MQSTTSRIMTTKTTSSRLRTIAAITIMLLAIQFLVGMVVNLYIQIPSVHPGASASNYFVGVVQGVVWAIVHSELALVIHTILGLLLVLASFILIGFAVAYRQRVWIITSLLGWVGIVGAGFNGASFLNYGHNFSSLLMSIGFLVAMISYVIGIYITH